MKLSVKQARIAAQAMIAKGVPKDTEGINDCLPRGWRVSCLVDLFMDTAAQYGTIEALRMHARPAPLPGRADLIDKLKKKGWLQ
jgi:hypothetical protein